MKKNRFYTLKLDNSIDFNNDCRALGKATGNNLGLHSNVSICPLWYNSTGTAIDLDGTAFGETYKAF